MRYFKLILIISISLMFISCDKKSQETVVSEDNVTQESEVEANASSQTIQSEPTVEEEVAQETTNEETKEVAKAVLAVNLQGCTGCHGQNFEKKALNKSKVVKDMTKDEVSNALIGYKNGAYGRDMKSVMVAQVAKYSDESLKNTGLGK
jgi:cytochrome c-type protein NapB